MDGSWSVAGGRHARSPWRRETRRSLRRCGADGLQDRKVVEALRCIAPPSHSEPAVGVVDGVAADDGEGGLERR